MLKATMGGSHPGAPHMAPAVWWGHFTLLALLAVFLGLCELPEQLAWKQPCKLRRNLFLQVKLVRYLNIIAHKFSRWPSLTAAYPLCPWEQLYELHRAAGKWIWTPTQWRGNCSAKGLGQAWEAQAVCWKAVCLAGPQDECCSGNGWRTYSELSRKVVNRNYSISRPKCS